MPDNIIGMGRVLATFIWSKISLWLLNIGFELPLNDSNVVEAGLAIMISVGIYAGLTYLSKLPYFNWVFFGLPSPKYREKDD